MLFMIFRALLALLFLLAGERRVGVMAKVEVTFTRYKKIFHRSSDYLVSFLIIYQLDSLFMRLSTSTEYCCCHFSSDYTLFFLFHSCLGFSFCTPRKMADQHLKGAESEWRENLHKVIHNFHWFTETASFFSSLHCVLRVVVYPQKYLVFNFVPLLRRRFGRSMVVE